MAYLSMSTWCLQRKSQSRSLGRLAKTTSGSYCYNTLKVKEVTELWSSLGLKELIQADFALTSAEVQEQPASTVATIRSLSQLVQ